MKMNNTRAMDFGDGHEPVDEFQNFEKIITDRRSVYSVSIGRVQNKEKIKKFLVQTKKIKNHHKATHHSWAVRISYNGVIYESKNDDGETGAGQIILRLLQKKHMINTVICVTRWYGGIQLESDRFKHIKDSALYALNHITNNNKK